MESGDGFWWAQLEEEVARRLDQPQYHLFAEGMHSDLRGQIFNLNAGGQLAPPEGYPWDAFVHVFIGITGEVDVVAVDRVFQVRQLSQLVILPGRRWSIRAKTAAAVEVITLQSLRPHG